MLVRLYGVASAIPRRCNLTANWRDTQLLTWMLGSNSRFNDCTVFAAALLSVSLLLVPLSLTGQSDVLSSNSADFYLLSLCPHQILKSIWFFLVVWNSVLWSDLYNQLLASSVQDDPRGGSFAQCNPSCKHHSSLSACWLTLQRERTVFSILCLSWWASVAFNASKGSSIWQHTEQVRFMVRPVSHWLKILIRWLSL